MNTLKSLLLGSAAALVVATGAQAASAPASFDKYTPTIDCPTGFWNMPGTDTCLRISGQARLLIWGFSEDNVNNFYWPAASNVPGAPGNLDADLTNFYSDARVRFDWRRNTDHGLLRVYVEWQSTDTDTDSGAGPNEFRLGFVQLGNWVFGKAVSSFVHGASTPNGTDFSPFGHTMRVVQVRYTHSIGNGLSASVALENPHYDNGGTANDNNDGRNDVPTAVISLNYASGPLDMQLSASVRDVDVASGTATAIAGAASGTTPENGVGYALGFGIAYEVSEQLNVGGKVIYTDNSPQNQMDWVTTNSSASLGEEALALQAFISYEATEDLTFQLAAGWADVDSDLSAASANAITQNINAAGVPVQVEGNLWGVQGLFSWRPVDGFEILGEVGYLNADDGLIADAAGPVYVGDADVFYGGLSIGASLN